MCLFDFRNKVVHVTRETGQIKATGTIRSLDILLFHRKDGEETWGEETTVHKGPEACQKRVIDFRARGRVAWLAVRDTRRFLKDEFRHVKDIHKSLSLLRCIPVSR